jgi:hypothetical protein
MKEKKAVRKLYQGKTADEKGFRDREREGGPPHHQASLPHSPVVATGSLPPYTVTRTSLSRYLKFALFSGKEPLIRSD